MHKCDNYPHKAKRAHHCHFKSNERHDLITIIDHLSGSLRSWMLLTDAYNSSWSVLITESRRNQYSTHPESSWQPFQRGRTEYFNISRFVNWKMHCGLNCGQWEIMLLEGWAFFWHRPSPLVPLSGRVTVDQYKVVLTDHLYPMMKHFYPDSSGVPMTVSPSKNHKGSLKGLTSMKYSMNTMIIIFTISTQVTPMFNWCVSLLQHKICFGRMVLHLSSWVPKTCKFTAKVN